MLAPIAIPLMTVAYIAYLAYVFAKKCVQPEYTPHDGSNGQMIGLCKFLEGVLEANFQAVLGLYSFLAVQR